MLESILESEFAALDKNADTVEVWRQTWRNRWRGEQRKLLYSRINKLYTFYHSAKNRAGPCQASYLHLALRFVLCWWVHWPASYTASHSWTECSPFLQPRGQAACLRGRHPGTMHHGFPWLRSCSSKSDLPALPNAVSALTGAMLSRRS